MTDDNVIDIKKQKKELERQTDLTEEKYYKYYGVSRIQCINARY